MSVMASTRKTKNGYELRAHVGNGSTRSRSIRAPHTRQGKHEAELEAAKWQARLDQQNGQIDAIPTLGQVANRWVAVTSPTWGKASARMTQYRLDSRILPRWGDTIMRDITLLEMQTWFASLKTLDDEPMAPSSLRTYKATLSGVYTFAVEHGFVDKNLCRSVKLPKIVKTKSLPDPAGISATIKATSDLRWSTLCYLAASTGMRRQEVCGLRWSDLDDGVIHIQRAISVKGEVGPTKNENSNRRIHLGKKTLKRLDVLRAERPYHLETSYIFSTQFDGSTPPNPNTVTRWWAENRRDDSITFHDIRHHAASQMLGAGIDVMTAAAILGQDPATTLRVYAHALPKNVGSAMSVLESVL